MNRMHRASARPADLSASRLRAARRAPRLVETTPHWLFRPMHYEANYAYPLVVWLHGPQDDERQLRQLMPLLSLRNYAAIGPRAVRQAEPAGYCWGTDPTGKEIELAECRALQCVELASRELNVAPRRVFIAGYEDGGTMALRIALRNPGRFAGAASLCGAFPTGHSPLSRLNELRQLPLLLSSGRDAQRYTVDQTCRELRLFHAAGLSVSLRQYPCGDELDTLMLRDLNAWVMEQVTGTPAECDSTRQYEPWSEESN